jgi:hypothetical protein
LLILEAFVLGYIALTATWTGQPRKRSFRTPHG